MKLLNAYAIPTSRQESQVSLVLKLREAITDWRNQDYPGISNTTRRLLTYWFFEDHKSPDSKPFSYYFCQREAIETLIYCYEVVQARNLYKLAQDFAAPDKPIAVDPRVDRWPRYTFKMATGSGKTKVMSLAIVWSYFHAIKEANSPLAKNFLLIAPNVIVFERLKRDFENGKIFRDDPLIPPEWLSEWDMQVILRDDAAAATTAGTLYLTNIQRLYEREREEEINPVRALVGTSPKRKIEVSSEELIDRILKHPDLMVLNDEGHHVRHHVHGEDLVWYQIIDRLDGELKGRGKAGLAAQLDFSATPRDENGVLFPWIIVDYPVAEAIEADIVKRPIIGRIEKGQEVASDKADVRYRPWIDAGIARWKEYQDSLKDSRRKPVLFVMGENTTAAHQIAEYLETLPDLSGKVLEIHTNAKGEIIETTTNKKLLNQLRQAAREVDSRDNPYSAIVSVLMLREGWDVKNVTVIVGLRPYSAKADILPEQTIGRGLRLMEGPSSGYIENVDVIGNKAFEDVVRELEKEGVTFGETHIGKDHVDIRTILPDPEKSEYDLSIPQLSPALSRLSVSLADIDPFKLPRRTVPLGDELPTDITHYEGFDALTAEKVIDRYWDLPVPEEPGAVVAYFTNQILEQVHLRTGGKFAELAPKIQAYLERVIFGKEVDLSQRRVLRRLNESDVRQVLLDIFSQAINNLVIKPQPVRVTAPPLKVGETTPAFLWSREVTRARKTVFNLVACDNRFEAEFASFLEGAQDIDAFAKLTQNTPFSIEYLDTRGGWHSYWPDFIVRSIAGEMFIVETKGREDIDVAQKDARAAKWCQDAGALTIIPWHYVKITEEVFRSTTATTFEQIYHHALATS